MLDWFVVCFGLLGWFVVCFGLSFVLVCLVCRVLVGLSSVLVGLFGLSFVLVCCLFWLVGWLNMYDSLLFSSVV